MKTETKHTQGPWKAHVAHELLNVVTDSVVTVDGLHVADVASYGASIATRNANARLIAAAPELLAALKAIAPIVHAFTQDELSVTTIREAHEILSRMQSAISKAEGNA